MVVIGEDMSRQCRSKKARKMQSKSKRREQQKKKDIQKELNRKLEGYNRKIRAAGSSEEKKALKAKKYKLLNEYKMCLEKRAYRSREEAEISGWNCPNQTRAYKCPHCGKWHVTHAQKEK